MKSFLISDNMDAMIGMKTAGINGLMMTEKEEIIKKIDDLIEDSEIGIVLLTRGIMTQVQNEVMDRKLKHNKTLIVEIPSPGETIRKDFITKYIRESIGLKF